MATVRTSNNYEVRNVTDNQVQVKVPAGTELQVRTVVDGYHKFTADEPVTKNGGKSFYDGDEALNRMTK